MLSGHQHAVRDGVRCQGAGAEALRVRSELVIFPLSMHCFLAMAPWP